MLKIIKNIHCDHLYYNKNLKRIWLHRTHDISHRALAQVPATPHTDKIKFKYKCNRSAITRLTSP